MEAGTQNPLARQDTGISGYSVAQIKEQVSKMQRLLSEVMVKDIHYGVIPGTGDKPSLYKPGAEKISLTFRLTPEYEIFQTDLAGDHREYRITCVIRHITTRDVLGEGVGLCSTRETKYRFRQTTRKCPKCGKPAIIKGKAEYGGGWLCYAKKDGCGAKFVDADTSITGQSGEREENPNIADTYNTVLKIAKKRAHVDSILTVTAASDIFTQDVEDMPDVEVVSSPPSQTTQPPEKEGAAAGGEESPKRSGGPPTNASQDAQNEPPVDVQAPDIPADMELATKLDNGFFKAREQGLPAADYWTLEGTDIVERISAEAEKAVARYVYAYWMKQE